MTGRVLSDDVERRLGVYKRLEEVPDRYRLYQHSNAYEGRDVWGEWVEAERERGASEWWLDLTETARKNWKDHMDDRGPHHALATPEDVDLWIDSLLDTRAVRTVYETYWTRVEQFYDWLLTRVDHPHTYNPVLMAVVDGDAAQTIWERKIQSGDEIARKRAEEGRIG